jgi:uncharacterized protein involved in response to NO
MVSHAPTRTTPANWAVFALGFRTFFVAAGAAGLALIAVWVYAFAHGANPGRYYGGGIGWHGHEMLFGYTMAVVAGFLLTAVRNWTGRDTPSGAGLASLALLWLAGRVAPFAGGWLPDWAIATIDLAFLPAVAAVLAPPLRAAGQRHNQIFLILLGLLTLANLLIHLQALGVTAATGHAGTYLAVQLLVLLIVVIAGRVLPFFTERAVPGARPWRHTWIEALAVGSAALLAATVPFLAPSLPLALLTLAAAAVHGVRLAGWYHRHIWGKPILWVLHLGYAWLVVGFALQGLAFWGIGTPLLAVHAFTAGAIGTLTLGMMARVSLGHTGREMHAPAPAAAAFVLITLAAALRVLVPLAAPARYLDAIVAAGICWSAAFVLFLWVYVPVLLRPRVDGRPG